MTRTRFRIIPAVFLLLTKDDKILLQRRFNTGWEDGKYSLISGHLNGDESATDAMLIREAKEETGITILSEHLKVVHVTHRRTGNVDNERIDIFYVSQRNGKAIRKITEKDKCDGLSWFHVNGLPPNTTPLVRNAIENYQRKDFYSEFGWKNTD
jgi:8-oxo-dGTP diphosphatase